MINTWFTSDLHLGHTNILEYEKEHRPFKTIEEMNEKLIENWNSVVKQKDIVYVLGDFAFGKSNISLAHRLCGEKRLVLGNHDYSDPQYYRNYFSKLFGMTYWKQCILSHMPVHSYNYTEHHAEHDRPLYLNVHGHLHSKAVMRWKEDEEFGSIFHMPIELQEDPFYFNVSVERHNLTPVHADLILERCKGIL